MTMLIGYHDKCNDGAIAATCVALYCKENEIDYILVPLKYDKHNDNSVTKLLVATKSTIKEIVIVDFSLTLNGYKVLREFYPTLPITTIDHHDGAEETLKQAKELHTCEYQFSEEDSGALLAYKIFQPKGGAIKLLAEYASDWDTWKKQYNGIEEFTAGLKATLAVTSVEDFIQGGAAYDYVVTSMISLGSTLVPLEQEEIKRHLKSAIPCTIDNKQGVAICCTNPALISNLGDAAHKQYSVDYALIWNMQAADDVVCSLRSKKEFNCIPLANLYGGGGHENAAGFHCTPSELINMLDDVQIHSERK